MQSTKSSNIFNGTLFRGGRNLKVLLGRFFNSELGCFDTLHIEYRASRVENSVHVFHAIILSQLVCYIIQGWQGFPWKNTLTNWAHL
jgi:hypothetical protein